MTAEPESMFGVSPRADPHGLIYYFTGSEGGKEEGADASSPEASGVDRPPNAKQSSPSSQEDGELC